MRVRLSLLAPIYKEESAIDFLEYINSYHCCAINGVKKWQLEELREKYPFVFNNLRGQHYGRNIRFENGVCASFCCFPYHCGDMF